MISRLLTYLKAGGDANPHAIARNLEIEEGSAEMMLEQLVSLGYLEVILPEEKVEDSCSASKCIGCRKKAACKPLLHAKYRIVEK